MKEIFLDQILSYKIKENKDYLQGGFYLIQNTVSGKKYVGKSINYMSRLKQHTFKSANKTLIDIDLNLNISEFKFYLIKDYAELEINFFNRKKESIIEQEFIYKNNANYPLGYNIRCYGRL